MRPASRWLLAVALFSACGIVPDSGTLICNPNGKACPDNYYCAADNTCWKTGETPSGDLSATLPDLVSMFLTQYGTPSRPRTKGKS